MTDQARKAAEEIMKSLTCFWSDYQLNAITEIIDRHFALPELKEPPKMDGWFWSVFTGMPTMALLEHQVDGEWYVYYLNDDNPARLDLSGPRKFFGPIPKP